MRSFIVIVAAILISTFSSQAQFGCFDPFPDWRAHVPSTGMATGITMHITQEDTSGTIGYDMVLVKNGGFTLYDGMTSFICNGQDSQMFMLLAQNHPCWEVNRTSIQYNMRFHHNDSVLKFKSNPQSFNFCYLMDDTMIDYVWLADGLAYDDVFPSAVSVFDNQTRTEPEISIYPNPTTTGKVNITGPEGFEVEVHNALGEKIQVRQINEGIQISENPGLYFVSVLVEEGMVVKKVLVTGL